MQAPKVTSYNGQRWSFGVRQEEVACWETAAVRGGARIIPESKPDLRTTGLQINALSIVTADRRTVRVHFMAEESDVVPEDPTSGLCPIPVRVIHTQRIEETLTIPDGETAIMYGWRKNANPVKKDRIPILSDIPYVSELLTLAGPPATDKNVLIAVTSRIHVTEEEEVRAVKLSPCFPMKATVAELLENYKKACREGRLADAKCLAERALSLDPGCFCDTRAP
jgi:type II secretory pathway component GspD/PulD (secretin)